MAISTAPTSDLPIWMRRALRKTDWAGLLSIAFSVLIALPMLLQPGLPRTNDSEHYVFQTENTAAALQEGRWYPRWSPHVLGGYGAPLPHYYPQGAAYAAALTQIVIAGDPVAAVQIVSALALTFAGMTVYTLVARRAGAAAGLIANLLYSFSPYTGLIAPYVLGDLPAVISLWLLPALLWGLDRLLSGRQPFDFALVSLTIGALVMTDLRYAAAGLCLGAIFIAWRVTAPDRQGVRWRAAIVALGSGVGLAACFWLPALVEINAVRWQMVSAPMNGRLSLPGLLAPLSQPDPARLFPTPQWTLGTPLVLFSLAAGLLMLRRRSRGSFQALFLMVGLLTGLIALLLMPEQTSLLGVITLCLSIGASSVAEVYLDASARRRGWLFTLLCLVIVAAALPIWLFPFSTKSFGSAAPAAQIEYELQGFGIAGLPRGLLLPTTLSPGLGLNRALINGYRTGDISKIDMLYLNSNVQIGFLEHTSHSDRLQVQTYAPTEFTVLTAYFPGWTASTNSGRVRLEQDADTGLISIAFDEALTTELNLRLDTTPIRAIAWAGSWASLALVALMTRRRAKHHQPFLTEYPLLRHQEIRAVTVLFVLVALTALLGFSGVLDGLRTESGSSLSGSTPIWARTDSGLEMASFQIANPTVRPGDTLNLTSYWRTVRALTEDYHISIDLVDAGTGQLITYTNPHEPGNYPTPRWSTARLVRDDYALAIPDDAPAADAIVRIEVIACDNVCDPATRLTFFDSNGAVLGQTLELSTRVSIAP